MSLNVAKHNEIHPIYLVALDEEDEDDNLIQEEIRTPAIAKISTAKGKESTLHFIDTDIDTPGLSLNQSEESLTRKYDENIFKRNNGTLHLKDI